VPSLLDWQAMPALLDYSIIARLMTPNPHAFSNDNRWNKDNTPTLFTFIKYLFSPLANFGAIGKMPEECMGIGKEVHSSPV
jgi:hypothetical protein